MKLITVLFAALLLLTACDTTKTYVLRTGSGSSASAQEYSNLYIATDTVDPAVYNISGSLQDPYEVHIE